MASAAAARGSNIRVGNLLFGVGVDSAEVRKLTGDIRQVAQTATTSYSKSARSTDEFRQRTQALKRETLSLRDAHEAGLITQRQLRTEMERLQREALQLTRGLDRSSREFRDLTLAAGRASRTLAVADGRVTKLGLSANVLAAINTRLAASFGAVMASLAPLIGVYGLFMGVRALDSFAREGFQATAQLRLFNRELEKAGESIQVGQSMLGRLAREFKITEDQVASGAVVLLRYGANVEQTEQLLRAGGASALAFGRDTAAGFEAIAQAIVGEQSQILNRIGVAGNLSTAYAHFADQIGKSTDELTNQEKVTAALNMIMRETESEIEALDVLMAGLGGATNRFSKQAALTRRELGERFEPAMIDLYNAGSDVLEVFRDKIAPALASALVPAMQNAAEGVSNWVTALTEATPEGEKFRRQLGDLIVTGRVVGEVFAGVASILFGVTNVIIATMAGFGAAIGTFSVQLEQFIASIDELAPAIEQGMRAGATLREGFLTGNAGMIAEGYSQFFGAFGALAEADLSKLQGDTSAFNANEIMAAVVGAGGDRLQLGIDQLNSGVGRFTGLADMARATQEWVDSLVGSNGLAPALEETGDAADRAAKKLLPGKRSQLPNHLANVIRTETMRRFDTPEERAAFTRQLELQSGALDLLGTQGGANVRRRPSIAALDAIRGETAGERAVRRAQLEYQRSLIRAAEMATSQAVANSAALQQLMRSALEGRFDTEAEREAFTRQAELMGGAVDLLGAQGSVNLRTSPHPELARRALAREASIRASSISDFRTAEGGTFAAGLLASEEAARDARAEIEELEEQIARLSGKAPSQFDEMRAAVDQYAAAAGLSQAETEALKAEIDRLEEVDAFRQLAAGLRAIGSATGGPLGDVIDGLAKLLEIGLKIDEIDFKQLAEDLETAENPLDTLMAFATSGVLDLIAMGLQFIVSLLGDMSNGAKQVEKQIDQMAENSDLLSRDLIEGLTVTERVSRGGFLGWLGFTKEAIDQELTQAALDIANDVANGFASGIQAGIEAWLDGDQNWAETLENGLKDAIFNALVNAFIEAAVLQAGVQDFIEEFVRLYQEKGAKAAMRFAEANFEGLVDDLTGMTRDFLDTVPEGLKPDAGEGDSGTSKLPGSTDPVGVVSIPNVPNPVLASPDWVPEFGGYVGQFGVSVGEFRQAVRSINRGSGIAGDLLRSN